LDLEREETGSGGGADLSLRHRGSYESCIVWTRLRMGLGKEKARVERESKVYI
jgi:hypothetical protein